MDIVPELRNVIIEYIFEVGFLEREPHNGVKYLGIKDPRSVAEHSFRAAHIAIILAVMEGLDYREAAIAMLFHDLPETRSGDQNLVNKKYVKVISNEMDILGKQLKVFPNDVQQEIKRVFGEYEEQKSDLGKIEKDADVLELAFSLQEYKANGLSGTELFLKNLKERLYSEPAKKIFDNLVSKDDINDWWYKGVLNLN